MLFNVDTEQKQVDEVEDEDLSSLGYLEQQDLQEWVVDNPSILGEELLVVTTEYSNFQDTNDRLDVLAVDKDGKLVVIELKRDRADRTTDLQAIKYASYCATLTAEEIQKGYRSFWSSRRNEDIQPEEVGREFRDFLETGYEEEIQISEEAGWAQFDLDKRPRIMLAAGEFGTEITAPVMWLLDEYGVDVTCTKIQAYQHGEDGQILLNSQQIIPVSEAEDYMTQRRKKNEEQKADSGPHEIDKMRADKLEQLDRRYQELDMSTLTKNTDTYIPKYSGLRNYGVVGEPDDKGTWVYHSLKKYRRHEQKAPITIRVEIESTDPDTAAESVRERHRDQLDELLSNWGIESKNGRVRVFTARDADLYADEWNEEIDWIIEQVQAFQEIDEEIISTVRRHE